MTANVSRMLLSCYNHNKIKHNVVGRTKMTANVSRMLLFLLQMITNTSRMLQPCMYNGYPECATLLSFQLDCYNIATLLSFKRMLRPCVCNIAVIPGGLARERVLELTRPTTLQHCCHSVNVAALCVQHCCHSENVAALCVATLLSFKRMLRSCVCNIAVIPAGLARE